MPISPSPTVTALPTTPVRGEDFSVFQPNAIAWVRALPVLHGDLNAFGQHWMLWQQALESYDQAVGNAATAAQGYANQAALSAAAAADDVVRATQAADGAEGYRDSARDASILAASNAGIPTLTGSSGDLLIVDTDELAVSLDVADQAIVGDITRAPDGVLSAPAWLLCDGSIYDDTVYPELFSVLGTTTLPNIPAVSDGEIFYYIKTGL